MSKGSTRVCYVLAYKDPNYIRTRVLLHALASSKSISVYEAVNRRHGAIRYVETLSKLVYIRIRYRPDIYVLGFRGYEILLPVRLLTAGRTLIFDEFINPVEWFVYEHKKIKENSFFSKALFRIYRTLLLSAQVILCDTDAHKNYSSKLMKVDSNRFRVVPVGTDETTFSLPATSTNGSSIEGRFTVLFYGSMLPLHGLEVMLECAELLAKKDTSIVFQFVGGKDSVGKKVELAKGRGANVAYKKWVEYEELPNLIMDSELCLGGPFGGTVQGNMVITGKTYQFWAMGKPVLIGDTAVNMGQKDKENCLIVPQSNPQAMARKILWAKANRQKLQKIGQNGRQLYQSRFSTTHIRELLEEIIIS